MDEITKEIASVLLAIVGVAIVAVIVSKNSQSPAVIQAAGSAFGNSLDVAISPVTGNTTAPNLSYPNSFGFGSSIG
jgi:PRD1 phage membrane DNA delivery